MLDHPDPELAATIKRLREAHGLTQEQLALRAQITVSALSKIERGVSSPKWTTLKRIATGLEVTLTDIAIEADAGGLTAHEPARHP